MVEAILLVVAAIAEMTSTLVKTYGDKTVIYELDKRKDQQLAYTIAGVFLAMVLMYLIISAPSK